MHIHCMGKGRPIVVLVGGLDDFSITWSLVQPEIAKTTRVCSYDRAGLGWSEASPALRTSENMVNELHTLLLNAKIESPYLMVGHSFGGALEYKFTQNLFGGVVGQIDRSAYYTPNYAILYLRYMFDAQTGAVPFPPDPVKAYSRF